jgi:cytochrome c oxidase subunit III
MAHTSDGVLATHFDDLGQQRSAMRLGMWMFLVTEAMFFGGVFCAYTAYRIWYPHEWEAASSALNVLIAGINSFLLLTSSLTITLAINAAHKGEQARVKLMLFLTLALALAFLGFKAYEYYSDFKEHLVPGPTFVSSTPTEEFEKEYLHAHPEATRSEIADAEFHHLFEQDAAEKVTLNPGRVQLFFMFYYIMTGLHVVHMLVGIGVIAWLYRMALQGRIGKDKFLLIEITSLYWHFVDMVWLFLMPLLYLAGPHKHLHF